MYAADSSALRSNHVTGGSQSGSDQGPIEQGDANMRLDSANLAPYDNYQVQFKPALGGGWGNWNGGLFNPAGVANSQYLLVTNGAGFFRLQ